MRTRDPEIAVDAINELIQHSARLRISDAHAVDFRIRSTGGADWGADQVLAGGVRYEATVQPLPSLVAGVVINGRGLFRAGGQEVALHRNDVFLYPPGAVGYCDHHDVWLSFLRIPLTYTARLAEESTGQPAARLRFLSARPVSEAMRGYWASTVHYLLGQLHNPHLEIPPLLADQMLRLAAGSLLRVFPNSTMTSGYTPPTGRVTPAVVRRAAAYMDAAADRPVSLAEVAAASGVGARALQAAFRRHLDLTPLAYLRRVRLERARTELMAARPGDGTTVTAVAQRWGFGKPSRFSADYHEAFGELPSHTLRT